jgi:hypothetical protein
MTVRVNPGKADRASENMTYVRSLLWRKQPGFAAALESAVLLAERDLAKHRPGPTRPADRPIKLHDE